MEEKVDNLTKLALEIKEELKELKEDKRSQLQVLQVNNNFIMVSIFDFWSGLIIYILTLNYILGCSK